MGISGSFIDRLMQLRSASLVPDKASVIEIGAQQLNADFLASAAKLHDLGKLFKTEGIPALPAPREPQILDGKAPQLDADAPSARIFWNWLGFDYAAIDIDGSPGAIPLDLNYDDVPAKDHGRYHIVTNFGSTEHVANQLNAFKVIHDLTALDGLMIHELPAQGMFNHGLVNYNFKFFWMLARSNAYRFIAASYSQLDTYPLPDNIIDFVTSFEPSARPALSCYSGCDAGIFVVMQKTLAIPYVPPLDVQTGSRTDIKSLKRRYWTIFDTPALDAAVARRRAKKLW